MLEYAMITAMVSSQGIHRRPRPRKSLGQNFLASQVVAQSIVDLASLTGEETVVEIGPGRGILTRRLLQRARRLIAIEYDPRLVTALKEEFKDFNNLEVVQGDALSYPFNQLPPDSKVVANLPYHIATPILFRLLEARKNLSLMVLMFQREVARRIVATAGNKEYSSLSLAVQYVGQPHLRMVVSRKCFRPSPKVESAVVTLIPHAVPPIPLKNEGFFYRLIRSAFMHRRKSLKNSLRETGYPEPLVEEALQQRGIAPLRRPESLTLAEYGALADILFVSMGEL